VEIRGYVEILQGANTAALLAPSETVKSASQNNKPKYRGSGASATTKLR
jgi:hypothetical protein